MTRLDHPSELSTQVTEEFLSAFPKERIVTLLGYGSMIDGRSANSDVDVYLLLDTCQKDDAVRAYRVAQHLPHVIDLAMHYGDEMPSNPSYFRLGNKSCLALSYLASAELLHGDHVPAEMFERLDNRALQQSALHAVFYYLGLMRTEVAAHGEVACEAKMDKYLARSIIDAMIFYKKMSYEPFKTLSSSEVVELAKEHPQLGCLFDDTSEVTTVSGKLEFMHRMHRQVRMTNWLAATITAEQARERGASLHQ